MADANLNTKMRSKLYSDLTFNFLKTTSLHEGLCRGIDNEILFDFISTKPAWLQPYSQDRINRINLNAVTALLDYELKPLIKWKSFNLTYDEPKYLRLSFIKSVVINGISPFELIGLYGKTMVDEIVGSPADDFVVAYRKALTDEYTKNYRQLSAEEREAISRHPTQIKTIQEYYGRLKNDLSKKHREDLQNCQGLLQ